MSHVDPISDGAVLEAAQRRVAPIVAWLLEERLNIGQSASLVSCLCERLHELGRPLLVGHSRKGFLGKLLGDEQADRTSATVGAALSLAAQGVQVIRVHDVRGVREALLAFEAAGGLGAS